MLPSPAPAGESHPEQGLQDGGDGRLADPDQPTDITVNGSPGCSAGLIRLSDETQQPYAITGLAFTIPEPRSDVSNSMGQDVRLDIETRRLT